MTSHDVSTPDGWRNGIVIVVATLVAIALLVPAQLASMILFDATGFDSTTPDFVFMAVLPGLATAFVPAGTAARLYDRDGTLVVAAAALLINVALAGHLLQYYRICGGPSC